MVSVCKKYIVFTRYLAFYTLDLVFVESKTVKVQTFELLAKTNKNDFVDIAIKP